MIRADKKYRQFEQRIRSMKFEDPFRIIKKKKKQKKKRQKKFGGFVGIKKRFAKITELPYGQWGFCDLCLRKAKKIGKRRRIVEDDIVHYEPGKPGKTKHKKAKYYLKDSSYPFWKFCNSCYRKVVKRKISVHGDKI